MRKTEETNCIIRKLLQVHKIIEKKGIKHNRNKNRTFLAQYEKRNKICRNAHKQRENEKKTAKKRLQNSRKIKKPDRMVEICEK